MGVATKIAAGAALVGLIAAGAALWFFASEDVPLTGILSPKEIGVAKDGDQQPAPGETTGVPGSAAQPVWRMNCSESQAGLDCRAVQTLFVKKTGQPFLTVAVRVPADTKTPVMLIQAPLGTYLPAGISVQFGQDAAQMHPFQSCNRVGCVAAVAVTEAEIAAMLNGADLTVSIQTRQKKPITLTVPAGNFAEAYARMR